MSGVSYGPLVKRARIRFKDPASCLAKFAQIVADKHCRLGQISTVHVGKSVVVRDLDVYAPSDELFDEMADAIRAADCLELLKVTDVVQEVHRGGKIQMNNRTSIDSLDDLHLVYTPGVASVCKQIEAKPALADQFTSIPNNVAIVTNGTAILGLGDIGNVAGMPVMEGKAMLFRDLADINGIPILVDSHDPDVIVQTVKAIAPTFGAVNLEDIQAPECFDIERRLDEALDIPVFHDDQHGTAVVVLASLLSIAKYTHINPKRSSIGIVGLGAAGNGIFSLLKAYGVEEIRGADVNEAAVSRVVQAGGIGATLDQVMAESDVVIATTGVPGLIRPEMVRPNQVILALSNPNPEIEPEVALEHGAAYAVDGKSVNNAMAFPGLFRGALDARAKKITAGMMVAAAKTISSFAAKGDLVPNILDKRVHTAVAEAVERVALKTGVVRFVESELEI